VGTAQQPSHTHTQTQTQTLGAQALRAFLASLRAFGSSIVQLLSLSLNTNVKFTPCANFTDRTRSDTTRQTQLVGWTISNKSAQCNLSITLITQVFTLTLPAYSRLQSVVCLSRKPLRYSIEHTLHTFTAYKIDRLSLLFSV